jgi:hypothetical protein
MAMPASRRLVMMACHHDSEPEFFNEKIIEKCHAILTACHNDYIDPCRRPSASGIADAGQQATI